MATFGASADINASVGKGSGKLFDFNSPSGWTMFFWSVSVLLLIAMFLSL